MCIIQGLGILDLGTWGVGGILEFFLSQIPLGKYEIQMNEQTYPNNSYKFKK